MKIKNIFSILVIFVCIFNIKTVIAAMKKALYICFDSIIPSLFIFMVLSDITINIILNDVSQKFSAKMYIALIGALCGFPIGATLCEKFCNLKLIKNEEASSLLPFCNLASPAFVIGAVGASMFGQIRIGIMLYVAQFLTCALPIMFLKCEQSQVQIKCPKSISAIFFDAIENAVYGMMKICALICFFTVILSLIEHTKLKVLAFFLEISCGCALAASVYDANPLISIGLCGFCLGFSGMCVHLQIYSVAKSIKVKYLRFVFTKFIQGIICAVFSIVSYNLLFTLELL